MLDPILVPLDGSQLAECVLPHAVAIARSFNAQINLLCVIEKQQARTSAQLFDLVNWQIKKTKTNLYLEKIKIGFQESGQQAQAIIEEGLVAEEITNIAQKQRVKLIILSSHGQNGLTSRGISSTSQKIILSAPASVFIVRANQPRTSELSEESPYQRILVPLDGSQRAENVLPVITQLARFHKSEVHLVQVVQAPELARQMPLTENDIDLSNRLVARNQQEAKKYLQQVKLRSYLEDISVQTHLITGNNTAIELHQLVDAERINLVALSAHGYSGNHQWPYGSIPSNFMLYGKSHLLIIQDLPAKNGAISFSERAER
jgi:nucleotide-binding universal stress UspA family protein